MKVVSGSMCEKRHCVVEWSQQSEIEVRVTQVLPRLVCKVPVAVSVMGKRSVCHLSGSRMLLVYKCDAFARNCSPICSSV